MSLLPKRVPSIDIFRAITMFFMIFVNDLSGVKNVPKWIDHVGANVDGLGFADTIFPAFLFIVGLSIPLAIINKQQRGASVKSIVGYIAYRSFALVLMGFYHVNMDNYDRHNWLPLHIWAIIVTLSFFLIWLDYSPKLNKYIKYALIGLGYVALIAMAIVYKGVPEDGDTSTAMQPQWWGILGVIGWPYLISSLTYLFSKGSTKVMAACLLVFVVMDVLLHSVFPDFKFWIITDGSSTALVFFGVLTTMLYRQYYDRVSKLIYVPGIVGTVLIAVGLLIRPYTEGISKIYSTPAWVLVSAGISLIVYSALSWLVDQKGKQNWFKLLKPAGTSTLTCYLIPYLLLFAMEWADFEYPDSLNEGIGGIARSFGVSFFVIIMVGLLEKARLRLKL